jgi:dienelactone hydrolase
VVSESLKLPAHIWRDYMEGAVLSIDRDYVDELSEIDVPTLILWGEQDALFPREEQERPASAIPGATLKIYPETGHAVHWERPEQGRGRSGGVHRRGKSRLGLRHGSSVRDVDLSSGRRELFEESRMQSLAASLVAR